jgi:myo-inositol-1(or 4)-monophosphatase
VRDLLQTAQSAALAGGEILKACRGDLGAIRSKSSSTDTVTDVDLAAGVAAVRAVLAADPHARFVIEEEEVYDLAGGARGELDDSEVWVIDPLDGTTSYVHGYPTYSVSVAALHNGVPVAGAIYNAALGEMNSAGLGLGATRDGVRIATGAVKEIHEALIITGFPYDRGIPLDETLAVLEAFLRNPVHGIRRDGSAAIDCSHVASGRADGYWEYSLKPWDVAAGVVILREAGAMVTAIDGTPWTPWSGSLCTANAALHAEMIELIASAPRRDALAARTL